MRSSEHNQKRTFLMCQGSEHLLKVSIEGLKVLFKSSDPFSFQCTFSFHLQGVCLCRIYGNKVGFLLGAKDEYILYQRKAFSLLSYIFPLAGNGIS